MSKVSLYSPSVFPCSWKSSTCLVLLMCQPKNNPNFDNILVDGAIVKPITKYIFKESYQQNFHREFCLKEETILPCLCVCETEKNWT